MLVALHGLTENDLCWHEVLAPHFRHLRCPLLPGHGHQPCPDQITVASYAADLAATMDDDSDLLGYSMGGRIATRLALDHPHKVRRLILVSTRPGLDRQEDRDQRQARDEALAQILDDDGVGPFVSWWENQGVLEPARPQSRRAAEDLRSLRLNHDARGLAAALRHLGQGVMEPLWSRLGELGMPVLLVAGAADTAFCADMWRMKDLIPDHQLVVIPDCGHAVHRECPQALIEAIKRFLPRAGSLA